MLCVLAWVRMKQKSREGRTTQQDGQENNSQYHTRGNRNIVLVGRRYCVLRVTCCHGTTPDSNTHCLKNIPKARNVCCFTASFLHPKCYHCHCICLHHIEESLKWDHLSFSLIYTRSEDQNSRNLFRSRRTLHRSLQFSDKFQPCPRSLKARNMQYVIMNEMKENRMHSRADDNTNTIILAPPPYPSTTERSLKFSIRCDLRLTT